MVLNWIFIFLQLTIIIVVITSTTQIFTYTGIIIIIYYNFTYLLVLQYQQFVYSIFYFWHTYSKYILNVFQPTMLLNNTIRYDRNTIFKRCPIIIILYIIISLVLMANFSEYNSRIIRDIQFNTQIRTDIKEII